MKIFISHSSRDETEAARLRDWLAARGDEAVMPARSKKQDQAPDAALEASVAREIAACDAVVLFVSPFYEASQLARIEEQAARKAGKPLLAVIAAPTTSHVAEGLRGRFDLTLDRKAGLATLAGALDALADETAPRRQPPSAARPTPAAAAGSAAAPLPDQQTPLPAAPKAAPPLAAAPAPSPAPADAKIAAPQPEPERRPARTFEHNVRLSIDEARSRLHTQSVPDWLAWAIGRNGTTQPDGTPPADAAKAGPFTDTRRALMPDWLTKLPLSRLPNGEALRRWLARSLFASTSRTAVTAGLGGLLMLGVVWSFIGPGEEDELRQELRNAKNRQAEFLTKVADHLLAGSDRETALLLFLEAIEQSRGAGEGLAARVGLYAAWLKPRDDLVFRGHGKHVSDVAFSADGCCLLSASWDETVRLWDIRTGRQVLALAAIDSPVNSAVTSPDGKRILTAAADGKARLYDAGSAALVHEFTGHSDDVTSVAFAPDGKLFASASADRSAILWDIATKKSLLAFKGHKGALEAVAFSPDGKRLVTGSADTTARIHNIEKEEAIAVLAGHTGPVRSVAFDASGGYVATASEDKTARMWNAYTGKTVRIFEGHDFAVMSVAFSADGKRLVTGSKDNTARVFDVASGETLMVLRGHDGVVAKAAFAADGKTVATASGDGLVRLWPLNASTDALVQEARRATSSCLSLAQRKRYFLPENPPAWCIEMKKPPYQSDAWQSWLRGIKAGRKPPLPTEGS